MNHVRIAGVHINLDQVGPFKTLKDLKAKGPKVFDHLSEEDQAAAYDELWEKGYGKPVEQATPSAGSEAASAAPAEA